MPDAQAARHVRGGAAAGMRRRRLRAFVLVLLLSNAVDCEAQAVLGLARAVAGPSGTAMPPKYMTITSSAICSTTARLCEMNT